MKKNQKEIVISLIAIVSLLVALMFTSLAIFNYTREGTNENKITSGTVTMNFTEQTAGILITDAHPIKDSEGKLLLKQDQTKEEIVTNGYFDFTVSANVSGDMTIGYDVYLENTSVEPSVADQYIKVYLTNGDSEEAYSNYETTVPTYDSLEKLSGDSKKRVIYHGEFTKGNVTQNFRLRLWIASTYGENTADATTSKNFKAKVGVVGEQTL